MRLIQLQAECVAREVERPLITVAAWTDRRQWRLEPDPRWVCGLGMVLGTTATQGGINR